MRINASTVIRWGRAMERDNARMKRAGVTALRRSAAYVWRVAKNSIRKKSKKEKHVWTDERGHQHEIIRWVASPVGTPPYDHGHGWKNTFRFEVDPDGNEAVIGPVEGSKHIAPELEFGGHAMVTFIRFHGDRKEKTKRKVPVRKRPTMALALDKSQARLAEFWKGVIR